MENELNAEKKEPTFVKKVLTVVSILFLFILAFLILKNGFSVLLLILAAVLLAAWFRGLSYFISDKWNLPEWLTLTGVILVTFAIVFLIFWQTGSKVSQQVDGFRENLPELKTKIAQTLSQYSWGEKLLSYVNGSGADGSGKLMATARKFFRTTFGVLGDIYVVLFMGIFFIAQPKLYHKGILMLVPSPGKKRADEILRRLGTTLRNWLTGKVIAMAIVTILTYVSLIIIGVPMALTLALIAGMLNFIPNFGPLLALIPAILVTAPEGLGSVWLVIGVYTGIQIVESNFITPVIQKQMIRIPPALILISQVLMGVLSGAFGVLLATPFVAILMVLVQELYVKDGLGKDFQK